MSDISVMPAQIVAWLQEQEPLEGLAFLTEYPARKKAIPLRNAVVAVGIETIKLQDSFTENDEGVLVENEYCRLANLRIKLGIHVPYADGGARCHDVFCKIMDCLTFATDLNILESGCKKTKADRDTDAFVLEAYIDVDADFCPADSTGLNFHSFLDKELLCGSHIRNDSLHFVGEEKERFLEPFVVGGYFGTDATSRSISLSFTPRMVFVFARGFPPVAVTFSNSSYGAYWGVATQDGNSSMGIELSGRGFRLVSTSSQIVRECLPRLNEAGVSYCYIAVR